MSRYQGRALSRAPRPRRAPLARLLRVLAAMAALGVVAMLPWRELRRHVAVLTRVQVTGLRYLDADRVRARSGLHPGDDLLTLDLTRARQRVLMDPRIERAEIHRVGLRAVEVRVAERVPALAVEHGEPWELDTAGVLLEPLQSGVVADVPMLSGPDFSAYRPGTQIRTVEVQRGLAWTAALSDNALRLVGQVSEVDVSQPRVTRLVLMNGVRVMAPAWPVGVRQLSGLRATLADLDHKGMTPREVDVRFPDQVIVRGAQPAAAPAAAEELRKS